MLQESVRLHIQDLSIQCSTCILYFYLKIYLNLPDGPAVKTPRFHCRWGGAGPILHQGTSAYHAVRPQELKKYFTAKLITDIYMVLTPCASHHPDPLCQD